jgi:hypothetical protein
MPETASIGKTPKRSTSRNPFENQHVSAILWKNPYPQQFVLFESSQEWPKIELLTRQHTPLHRQGSTLRSRDGGRIEVPRPSIRRIRHDSAGMYTIEELY